MKLAGVGIAIVAAIVALAAGCGTIRVALPTSTPSPTPSRAAGVPQPCAADVRGMVFSGGSITETATALSDWAASHQGEPASVVLTDDALASELGPQAARRGLRDGTFAIREDGVHVAGQAVVFGASYPVSARVVPSADGQGGVRTDVRDLDTDGMPGFFQPAVEAALEQAADLSSWHIPLAVDDVTLRSGCAVVAGTARP